MAIAWDFNSLTHASLVHEMKSPGPSESRVSPPMESRFPFPPGQYEG